jgi:hypothetical protein
MESDDFYEITKIGSMHTIDPYPNFGGFRIAHIDGDDWYVYYNPGGGGSGEAFHTATYSSFLRVNPNGDVFNFGDLGAAHVVWHGGYFYYIQLTDGIFFTPGVGRIMRVNMDGSNVTAIVNDPVYGPFQITQNRIFFSCLATGAAYSTDLLGGGKTPVGSRIAPDFHRVHLEFYGDFVISRFWNNPGFSMGVFVMPNEHLASPAIMDAQGNSLITFPNELRGENAYEVINWNNHQLFLRSARDGSYWLYNRIAWQFSMAENFGWGLEQFLALN